MSTTAAQNTETLRLDPGAKTRARVCEEVEKEEGGMAEGERVCASGVVSGTCRLSRDHLSLSRDHLTCLLTET
eukprot:3879566-Rhodomonas_salina.1